MGDCVVFLGLLSAIAGLVYLYLSWNFNFWKKRGVAGPEPKLIFGNVPSIIKRDRNLAFEFQELYEKYKKSGERFIGIFMTRKPEILVTDPNLAREILVTKFNYFRGNVPSLWVNRKEEWVSTRNPFMTTVSNWKSLRSDLIGGLSPNRIKQAYPIVLEICKKLNNIVKFSLKNKSKSIEVKNLCYKYTTEIVADFVWGISANTLDEDDSPNQMFNMSRKMLDDSFMTVGFFYVTELLPILRKIIPRRFYPEETDNFFSQVQKDALAMRLSNNNNRQDFLNYLIQLQEKKNISHMDMVGHSLTVLLDAFETTGSIMAHALYYLAKNQYAQIKLREEIMNNLDENGCLGYDELIELPYLDQCINETIRIVTVVSVSSRICSEEIYLENRENHRVKIEPGMTVHVSTFSFHYDADVFPNPDEFIPERFDNGRAKELNQKGYFFPFGDGPRICAGMRLGQLEAKAGIVEIIKNFKLKANDCGKMIDPNSFLLGLSGDVFVEFEAVL